MPAIITSQFRLENSSNFKDAVLGESIYLGIGKSDRWLQSLTAPLAQEGDIPTPKDTLVERNDFWQNAIAFKKVDSSYTTHLIPRINWTSGTTYVPWDDSQDTGQVNIFERQFYVITDAFNVYKLIFKTGTGPSTVMPVHTNQTVNPVGGADGYYWKYMYTVSATEATNFLTNNYMPVPVAGGTDPARVQYQQDSTANAGKIYRVEVTNQGSGYSQTPTVTIVGDGSGATATATVVNGAITAININNITTTGGGSGYNVANVIITDSTGVNAAARAILSPKNGHGTNPVAELGGFYIGLRVVLNGGEGSGDFIVNGAQFRQLGLVKNPYNYGSTTVSTAATLSALKTITLGGSLTGTFLVGDYITGGTSGSKAFVDSVESVGGNIILKIHQNDKTGYGAFSASEVITGTPSGASGTVGSQGNPEIQRFSGDVLFVESRGPVSRSASQLEDIKIIIEF